MEKRKRIVVFTLLGIILLLAGSFFAVDWMIFLFGIKTIYAGVAKPVVSLICLILVLLIGKDGIDRRDTILLVLAFICILPVDILMSVVALSPNVGFDSPQFMVGGTLSIAANLILIVRHGRGFPYLHFKIGGGRLPQRFLSFIWLPLLAYGLFIIAFIPLLKPVIAIGHLGIGLSYSAFLATSMWIAWETIRHKLYPRLNAWLAGIGITCWYFTEVVGEVFNIQIGVLSSIAYNIVWIFYGTCIVCLALSGYRWTDTG